jgi:ERCC4-related helicase
MLDDTPSAEANLPVTRGYQQEMLEESTKRNIIIAMDTGSGKTHIAVLRIKHEIEREPSKVCVVADATC